MIKRNASIAEFFSKNKQFLGFTNPQRSLFTVVKELLDNAIDVIEESKIEDPIIKISLEELENNNYKVVCEDNGIGINEKEIPHVFCRFLYGHKFFEKRQSRGQQGIGLTASVLYAQQSTGNPVVVISRTKGSKHGYRYKLMINVSKNEPIILSKEKVNCDIGTKVEMIVKGKYNKVISEYVKRTAKVNPHVTIVFNNNVYKRRCSNNFDIKGIPVTPNDIDFFEFKELITKSNRRKLASFIYHTFRGIGWTRSKNIECKIGKSNINELNEEDIKNIYTMLSEIKVRLNNEEINKSVYGFGEELIKSYLQSYKPEKIFVSSFGPEIYKNEVFLIEVGCAYGVGNEIEVHRYANRMPLLYSKGACVITKAINSVNWKYYKARRGMVFLVHIASTNIPYSQESKDAIANVDYLFEKITSCLKYFGQNIRTWENYKEKYSYISKVESKFKKLGEYLKDV